MPDWVWIVVAAAVVLAVVAIIAAATAGNRKRTHRLKQHFGPEYDRAVFEAGDQKAAEKELAARERKRSKLDIRPLPPESQAEFSRHWHTVQTGFVDDPSTALGDADRLVTAIMRERGYPVDDFDQRAADISVDHPTVVENYRAAHGIHLSQRNGDVGTELQRQAFVHYRALFEQLLDTQNHQTRSQEASS
jgi:hypothetical protein